MWAEYDLVLELQICFRELSGLVSDQKDDYSLGSLQLTWQTYKPPTVNSQVRQNIEKVKNLMFLAIIIECCTLICVYANAQNNGSKNSITFLFMVMFCRFDIYVCNDLKEYQNATCNHIKTL